MSRTEHNISILVALVGNSVGRKMTTTDDFAFLSGSILERTHETIGINTLKRLWGLSKIKVQPRIATLNVLSRYVGFRSWDEFVAHHEGNPDAESSHIVMAPHILSGNLTVGDHLLIAWSPGRECEIEYLGLETFRVITSVNSKILPGNTFQAHIFIEGQPLMVNQLIQDSSVFPLYVAGAQGGLTHVELLN